MAAFTSLSGVVIGGLIALLSALYMQLGDSKKEQTVNTIEQARAIIRASGTVDSQREKPNKPIKQGLPTACSVPLRCTF